MNDLISRQAAIDVIRAMQTYKLFAGDELILVDKSGAMTELMMLPPAQPELIAQDAYVRGFGQGRTQGSVDAKSQPEQKWIPCSERLPEESADYLVSVRWHREDDIEISVYDYNAWHKEWNDGESCGQRVIAWMPLPKPYKEGDTK